MNWWKKLFGHQGHPVPSVRDGGCNVKQPQRQTAPAPAAPAKAASGNSGSGNVQQPQLQSPSVAAKPATTARGSRVSDGGELTKAVQELERLVRERNDPKFPMMTLTVEHQSEDTCPVLICPREQRSTIDPSEDTCIVWTYPNDKGLRFAAVEELLRTHLRPLGYTLSQPKNRYSKEGEPSHYHWIVQKANPASSLHKTASAGSPETVADLSAALAKTEQEAHQGGAIPLRTILLREEMGAPVIAWIAPDDGRHFDSDAARQLLTKHISPLGYSVTGCFVGPDRHDAQSYCNCFLYQQAAAVTPHTTPDVRQPASASVRSADFPDVLDFSGIVTVLAERFSFSGSKHSTFWLTPEELCDLVERYAPLIEVQYSEDSNANSADSAYVRLFERGSQESPLHFVGMNNFRSQYQFEDYIDYLRSSDVPDTVLCEAAGLSNGWMLNFCGVSGWSLYKGATTIPPQTLRHVLSERRIKVQMPAPEVLQKLEGYSRLMDAKAAGKG